MKEEIYKNNEVAVVYQMIFGSSGEVDYIGVFVRRLDGTGAPWNVCRESRPYPFERCDFAFPFPFENEEIDDYRKRISVLFATGIMDATRCSSAAAADAAGTVCCALAGHINTRFHMANGNALPYGGRGFGLNF